MLQKKIDRDSVLTKNSIDHVPVCNLMEQVKTRAVVLNLCYQVGDCVRNDVMRTETLERLFKVANIPFCAYIFYLHIYLRVFFNVLKLAAEVTVDNYLSEHCCNKETVKNNKKRINNMLISCYSETGSKLLRFLNVILSNVAFEHIFFTYR